MNFISELVVKRQLKYQKEVLQKQREQAFGRIDALVQVSADDVRFNITHLPLRSEIDGNIRGYSLTIPNRPGVEISYSIALHQGKPFDCWTVEEVMRTRNLGTGVVENNGRIYLFRDSPEKSVSQAIFSNKNIPPDQVGALDAGSYQNREYLPQRYRSIYPKPHFHRRRPTY